MARFDFITAAAQAYEFFWKEKSYLLRMAIPVLFVNVACAFAVLLFVKDGNPLREGIFMMPSHVVEAVYIVCLVRFIAYKEPIFSIWKPVPLPQDFVPIQNAYRGGYSVAQSFKSGAIIYVLLCMLDYVFGYAVYITPVPSDDMMKNPDFIGGQIVGMALWMFFILYLFRFLFLYIPFSLGCSPGVFARVTRGGVNALRMVVCAVLCTVPLFMFLATCIVVLKGGFAEQSALYIIVDTVCMSFLGLVLIINVVTAMTYGLEKMISDSVTKRS